MSSAFQPKRKELAKVKVVSSSAYSDNRSRYKFVGSVNRDCCAFITTKRNRDTGKCTFVDDTVALTKRSKNELVRFFMDKKNKGKSVAYLVVSKPQAKQKNLKSKGEKK